MTLVRMSTAEAGTKTAPYKITEHAEGFDAARDSHRPVWCLIGADLRKYFPSGHMADTNGKAVTHD